MIYAFVDTNIFVRVATQGRPGCEQSHFDNLRVLVQEGMFRLLVPEVLALEVDKLFKGLPRSIESACDKLNDAVGKATQDTWNEIDSLKVEVLTRIKAFKQEKVKECKDVSSQIVEFLQTDAVTNISLSPEILVAAKRRQIVGSMPNSKKSSDQDALIVESLASFFRNCNDSTPSLMFCTENTTDFALEITKSGLERRFVVDPQIQVTLPPTRFSTDLASMLSVARGFEELPQPTNDEIEYAANMRDLHDIDDEEFGLFHQILTDAVHKETARQFEQEFLPSVPDDIRAVRSQLSEQIRELLVKCRRCTSWGDGSEYKLPQWIEYVDEPMIPYTSLPKMVRVKKGLERYLEVHQQMDRDNPKSK